STKACGWKKVLRSSSPLWSTNHTGGLLWSFGSSWMNSCSALRVSLMTSDVKVSIMTEKDQGKFARRAQRILHRDQPMSLADLMGEEDHEHGYTEIQESEYTENRETDRSGSAVREEVRVPGDLADTLREYAHHQRL